MTEWLRRWTRNPMGFPRVGSNPACSDHNLKFSILTGTDRSVEFFLRTLGE